MRKKFDKELILLFGLDKESKLIETDMGRYAGYICKDPNLAEDILTQTIDILYTRNNEGELDKVEDLRNYTKSIIYNTFKNSLLKGGKKYITYFCKDLRNLPKSIESMGGKKINQHEVTFPLYKNEDKDDYDRILEGNKIEVTGYESNVLSITGSTGTKKTNLRSPDNFEAISPNQPINIQVSFDLGLLKEKFNVKKAKEVIKQMFSTLKDPMKKIYYEKLFQKLGEICKSLLGLKFAEHTHAQIAKIMNMSRSNVTNKMLQCIEELKKIKNGEK